VNDDETRHFRANLMTEAEFRAKTERHYETPVTAGRGTLKQTWCGPYVPRDKATSIRHLVTCDECRRLANIRA